MNVEREIHKENTIRKIRNVEFKRIREILLPFVGSKIRKADGEMIKKAHDLLQFDKEREIEPLTKGGYARLNCMYINLSEYSLYLKIDICFNGGSYEDNSYYCEYKHSAYYLGSIKNSMLTEIYDYEDMAMLDVKAQCKQYDKVQGLKRKLVSEKDKLFYELRK